MEWFLHNHDDILNHIDEQHLPDGRVRRLLSLVNLQRLPRVLHTMLDEEEFLSPYGLRALAASHRDRPFALDVGGMTASVDYEPGESTTALFGGNSNWRGPIWFPVNYLVIEALRAYGRYLGDDLVVECPTGSGRQMTMTELADELSRRLVSIFLDDRDGRRPVFGHYERFQRDPALHDMIPFHEYFHGDTGMGLGASHQTGWTGLVADLIMRRRRPEPAVSRNESEQG
jgi:hypothetical protein